MPPNNWRNIQTLCRRTGRYTEDVVRKRRHAVNPAELYNKWPNHTEFKTVRGGTDDGGRGASNDYVNPTETYMNENIRARSDRRMGVKAMKK